MLTATNGQRTKMQRERVKKNGDLSCIEFRPRVHFSGCLIAPKSHKKITPLLIPQPEAIVLPSGLNATVVTQSNWPLRVASSLPVLVSHNLIVRSGPPEANRLPSGLKATDDIPRSCPFSVARTFPAA